MLVHDAESLACTIKRLHVLNTAVLFWNEQHSLKLMLRNDPVDADMVACELAVVVEEGDEIMARIMDLMNDVYQDEPGTFILENWSFAMDRFGAEDASRIMQFINDAYLYRICPCGHYLIKDDAAICVFCQMTSTPSTRAKHFCSICCEDGMSMHMRRQACCQQYLHATCLEKWKAKSAEGRCPLCRGGS